MLELHVGELIVWKDQPLFWQAIQIKDPLRIALFWS